MEFNKYIQTFGKNYRVTGTYREVFVVEIVPEPSLKDVFVEELQGVLVS